MTLRSSTSAVIGVLLLSSLTLLGCPQEETHFGWIYPVDHYVESAHITPATNGGYFVVSENTDYDSSLRPREMVTLKLSDTGETEWRQIDDVMYGGCCIATPDGGILLAGKTNAHLRVIKRDRDGNTVWDYTYGEVAYGVRDLVVMAATPEGGCVIVAGRYVLNIPYPFVQKLDPQGNTIWEHSLSAGGRINVTDIAAVGEDGFVVSGNSYEDGYCKVVRIDDQGNTVWLREYNVNWDFMNGLYVDSAQDGGFIVAGASDQNYHSIPAVIHTNTDGGLLWSVVSTLPGDSWQTHRYYTTRDMLVDADGNIVVVGESWTILFLFVEPIAIVKGYIMQLDSTGNQNWYTSLSTGSAYQRVSGVTLIPSGDYITVGAGGSGIQVIRVSKDGKIM